MLTIGEFARYAEVSVRMLRHYDAIGLLVPARVDPTTGYRHYAATQLARANRLVALKDLGFTLEQVGSVLDAEVGVEQLAGMLTLRRAQIREQMSADDKRLRAIEARLRMIEKEGTMSELEFVEKPLSAVCLGQLTTVVSSQAEVGDRVGPLFDQVGDLLASAGHPTSGNPIAWYQPTGDGMEIGVGWPTNADRVPGAEVAWQPAHERALTVLHRGSMATIGDTWQALVTEAERRGELTAPCREVYLETPTDDVDAWVTELQQPLR